MAESTDANLPALSIKHGGIGVAAQLESINVLSVQLDTDMTERNQVKSWWYILTMRWSRSTQ